MQGYDGKWNATDQVPRRAVTGGLIRYLGDATLVEDNSIRTEDSLRVNVGITWRLRDPELRADMFNLFDSSDDDIAYYYASRLPGERSEGIEDIHFTRSNRAPSAPSSRCLETGESVICGPRGGLIG